MLAGKGGYEQQEQAGAWQAYIAWEKQNAQQQAPPQLAARVSLAYECALTVLMRYPEACPDLTPAQCMDCFHAANSGH